jgi:hypothetical protein
MASMIVNAIGQVYAPAEKATIGGIGRSVPDNSTYLTLISSSSVDVATRCMQHPKDWTMWKRNSQGKLELQNGAR